MNIGAIERRLRSLEQCLDRPGGRFSASAGGVAANVGESVASALSSMADELRGGASSATHETAKIGGKVAKLGNDALRRLIDEVEHRPLTMLAVAVGVGIVLGLASHRR